MLHAVAHQMLSAGKGKNAVRDFLESHRMGHLLQHQDLHHTLEHLTPPLPGMKKTSISLAVSRFKNRLHNAAARKPAQDKAASVPPQATACKLAGSARQAPPTSRSPPRLRRPSFTSVTGTWGPPPGAKAVSLLSSRAVRTTDAAATATVVTGSSGSGRKATASTSIGSSKHKTDGWLQGDTSGSTKIGAWNCEEGGAARTCSQPTEAAVSVEAQHLSMQSGKVSFATEAAQQHCAGSVDDGVFHDRGGGAHICDKYRPAMVGIPSRQLPNQGGECALSIGENNLGFIKHQDQTCTAHNAPSHHQQHSDVSAQDSEQKGRIEGADWNAPERDIIDGFLSMFDTADK